MRVRPPWAEPLLVVVTLLSLAEIVWFAVNFSGRVGPPILVIGLAGVVLTGLVMGRQLMAFRDNSRLLGEIARQERRFRSLVQHAADVILVTDGDGVTVYVSPGIERITGHPASAFIGRQGFEVHPDDLPMVVEKRAEVLAAPGVTTSYEARIAHRPGRWRWAQVTLTNRLDDPAVSGMVTNISDVTELRAYHERLSHQASHDSLTDLANRSLFAEELQRAITRSGGERLSLAFIDLDDFKLINDTLGHQAGDAMLIAVSERLRRGVRDGDLVARLGGDEFAVLLENVVPSRVDTIAERMLDLLAEPLLLDGQELCVQASIGVAEVRAGDDADRLMRHADIAMYEAKAAGKARYARYAETMAPRTSDRAQAAIELDRALGTGEFELYYQPIVSLPDGRLIGAEALLRWNHPERGLVPPLDFIPAAEQTGLIVPIGRWVLEEACAQAARWLGEYPKTAPQTISVNVSPRQLREASIVDDVTNALASSGLAPERLVVEVTESAVVHQACAVALRTLSELGVRVSLDDFGTGQSTLSLIDSFPVDQVKLDRSFLRIGSKHRIPVAVIKLAEALGLESVAEGVESAEQAEHLYGLGYRLAQGFHFARPAPAAHLTDVLRAAQDGSLNEVTGQPYGVGGTYS
jgi:diguanylate cyclase (GGDEF)-like protein/PAS domain S-box-containing protein